MHSISKRLVDTATSPVSYILSVAAGNSAIADVYRTAAWWMPTMDGVWTKGEWVLNCIRN